MNFIPITVEAMAEHLTEDKALCLIGSIAGECYNSSRTDEACIRRALVCITRGHHSPFEHYNITLKCTVDRGTSHALVRHRHCAFQQSSTIYQRNEALEIINLDGFSEEEKKVYNEIEHTHNDMLKSGISPARARDILPTAIATNLIITTNIRQWMYMIERRSGSHGEAPRMQVWHDLVLKWFSTHYPRTTIEFAAWYRQHPL